MFCSLLNSHFSDWIAYREPEGGMAVWANFEKSISLDTLAETCLANGLLLAGSQCHNLAGSELNAIRLGFASINKEEIEEVCKILNKAIKNTISSSFSVVS